MALTVAGVEKWCAEFTPSGKRVARLGDGKGLYLEGRRSAMGAVSFSWVARWRDAGELNSRGVGKDRSRGLGEYRHKAPKGVGGYVTLAQAREKAKELRESFDTVGRNPTLVKKANALKARREASETADRERQLQVHTVATAVRGWHAATSGALTSPKYAAQRLRRLEDYLQLIGDTPVELLTAKQVTAAHEKFITAKPGNRAGVATRPETQRRTAADLDKAIEWAISGGWTPPGYINPVAGTMRRLPKKPDVQGRRTIAQEDSDTPTTSMPDFWTAAKAAGAGQQYPVVARLLQLLTLTAARTKELRLMTWSDLDDAAELPRIQVPADRMKRRKPWNCFLSPQALAILKEIKAWQALHPDLDGVKSGYVFVHLEGPYKGYVCSENSVNNLLKSMGWHDRMTGHGLRKLFSTMAHNLWPYRGPNRALIIELSLAHVSKDTVRATYDLNKFHPERVKLMTWWASHLEKSLQGTGKVLELRRA